MLILRVKILILVCQGPNINTNMNIDSIWGKKSGLYIPRRRRIPVLLLYCIQMKRQKLVGELENTFECPTEC